MQETTFVKGMSILKACFQNLDFNAAVYWELLHDLEDKSFENAVMDIGKTLKELYPGSNLPAIIREKALGEFKARIEERSRLLEKETEAEKLERWKREAIPMPEELKKAVGLDTGV